MKLIDIGCFNGDSVLHFVADPEVDSIVAYDPNPRFHGIWQAIADHYPHIIFVNKAISNKNGQAEYNLMPERRPLGSSITKDKRDFGNGQHLQVDVIDIAEVIDSDCWLKLDSEGEEFNILERLIETDKLKHIKRIYLEWHTSKLQGDYRPRYEAIVKELEKQNVDVRGW